VLATSTTMMSKLLHCFTLEVLVFVTIEHTAHPFLHVQQTWFVSLACKMKHKQFYVRFEVLIAVVMKSTTFWDITPCNPFKVYKSFGGTYHLHLQGRRINRTRNFQRTTRRCIPVMPPLLWSGVLSQTANIAVTPQRFQWRGLPRQWVGTWTTSRL
jgi:hypothetical protein